MSEFKVGDEVRVTANDGDYHGLEGTVVKVDNPPKLRNDLTVPVIFSKSDSPSWFAPSELEKRTT